MLQNRICVLELGGRLIESLQDAAVASSIFRELFSKTGEFEGVVLENLRVGFGGTPR